LLNYFKWSTIKGLFSYFKWWVLYGIVELFQVRSTIKGLLSYFKWSVCIILKFYNHNWCWFVWVNHIKSPPDPAPPPPKIGFMAFSYTGWLIYILNNLTIYLYLAGWLIYLMAWLSLPEPISRCSGSPSSS